MKKIYVFGDIHGELSKLENLLSKIPVNENDTLIFLGDYVDRGPDSCGVIELLLNLNKKHPCVFIKGNHDYVFFTDVLYHGNDLNKHNLGFWDEGAKATLKSYRSADINPEDHLETFYRFLKPYHVQDNKLFVHAGIERELSVHAQPDDEIFWWDRELIHEAEQKHRKLSQNSLKFADGFDTVFLGHTPVQIWGYEVPCKWTNVWNLDTGSGKYPSGRLSCLEVFSETIYQSDF
jgi:serine/threonine protein phosphatase 1